MRITLCGSAAFIDEMDEMRKKLEQLGHEVKLPPLEIMNESGKLIPVKEYYALRKSIVDDSSWIWKRKSEAMWNHFDKIKWADIVLICNYDKNDIEAYVGANTLLEMGVALYLQKPIYLLNQIPDMSYKEEILGMRPVVINGDLGKI